jgi:chorismate binding enzyme
MGAVGRVYGNGDLELALTIRTFAVAEGEIHLWVGGGIVWDSDPASEIEESWTKARPLLEAIGSRVPAPAAAKPSPPLFPASAPAEPAPPLLGGSVEPTPPAGSVEPTPVRAPLSR